MWCISILCLLVSYTLDLPSLLQPGFNWDVIPVSHNFFLFGRRVWVCVRDACTSANHFSWMHSFVCCMHLSPLQQVKSAVWRSLWTWWQYNNNYYYHFIRIYTSRRHWTCNKYWWTHGRQRWANVSGFTIDFIAVRQYYSSRWLFNISMDMDMDAWLFNSEEKPTSSTEFLSSNFIIP